MNNGIPQPRRPISNKSKAIGAIIFIIIVTIIIASLLIWNMSVNLEQQRLLAEGCEPKAWDSWGQVSIWACPPGVE